MGHTVFNRHNKRALEESLTIRDDDIEEVVRNLKKELNHADPKIRKRAVQ